jgi:hypothetical protein
VRFLKRTISSRPCNYAGFHVKCMEDGCANGGYDLAPVVADLAKSRKKTIKGKICCRGTIYPVGHGSIAYEVDIQFAKLVT